MNEPAVEDMRKNAMQTFTGKMLDVFDPDPADVDIFDIAHHLALMTRFHGACNQFYSIAQHSVLCCGRADDFQYLQPREDLALVLLMHDAAEAYVGDIVRPIKRGVPEFAAIEKRVMSAINQRFDLPRVADNYGFEGVVKQVDNRMLVTEKLQLMPSNVRWAVEDEFEPYDLEFESWSPRAAELLFLSYFARFRPDEVSLEKIAIAGVPING